ncbi:MAG: hypothetical protein KA354_09855 [Phycisphaerae bacterium]|nr:hypothetical protein [Phycisphaerae bacterium]
MFYRKAHSDAGAVCTTIVLSAAAALLIDSRLTAHTVLMDCVQHRVALAVDRANIDVDVELIFGEWQSLLQRRQMDRDGDDTVSSEERAAYERYLAGTLIEPLSLLIDGRRLDLIPLYEPSVDLGGSHKTSLSGHQVRLSYFARTPSWLAVGSQITLSDGLWTRQPALSFLNVTGGDGFRLVVESVDSAVSPWATGGPRLMQARCTLAGGAVAPRLAAAAVAGLAPAASLEPHLLSASSHRGAETGGGSPAGAVLLVMIMAALGVVVILRPTGLSRQGGQH